MRSSTLIVAGFLLWQFSSHGQITNGGFEQGTAADGIPSGGWWLYQAKGNVKVAPDSATPHSGHASVVLHSEDETKAVLVSSKFQVSEGDQIQFQAWTRVKGPSASGYAGLAFRRQDGSVFSRAYFPLQPGDDAWTKLAGVVSVPAGAAAAEVHLGYTNSPAFIWFDDVSAVITNALSMRLAEQPKPWCGEQELAIKMINRGPSPLRGTLEVALSRQKSSAVANVPAGSEVVFRIPVQVKTPGAHDYVVTFVQDGERRKSFAGKLHTLPPLTLYPPCPCYHLAGPGDGKTRLDSRINVSPEQIRGAKLEWVVSDSSWKPITNIVLELSQPGDIGTEAMIPVNPPGRFHVVARLVQPGRQSSALATNEIRVASPGDAAVRVDSSGFLKLNGKSVVPIGLYSCGQYEQMGRAGFLGTHNYGITTGDPESPINPNDANLQNLLERSWTNGMKMMVELPRKAIEHRNWAQVRRRIETFRHHPGLMCWGSEERVARGEAPLRNIAELYKLVHELDPNHPLVLGDTKDVIQKFQKDRSDFFPDNAMDIGIWWWYPIPLKEPDANGLDGPNASGLLEPPSWLTTTLSKKPLWIAIQAYQKPNEGARFPTPAEYRAQAYISLLAGAKSVWFYTGSGQRDYQGRPSGLLNKPEEARWDYVQALVTELNQITPSFMAPKAGDVAMIPANAPVLFTARTFEGATYLIAASKSPRKETVSFRSSLFRHGKVSALFEAANFTIQGDLLVQPFEPLAVHVLKVEPH